MIHIKQKTPQSENILAVGVCAYFLAIVVFKGGDVSVEESDLNQSRYQLFGVSVFLAATIVSLLLQTGSETYKSLSKSNLLWAFFLYCFLILWKPRPYEQTLQQFIYITTTAAVAFAFHTIWANPLALVKAFKICASAYLLFLVVHLGKYELGVGRTIGGITPNHIANIAVVGIFLSSSFERAILRLLYQLAFLSLIFYVNSRGGILAGVIIAGPTLWELYKTKLRLMSDVVQLVIITSIIISLSSIVVLNYNNITERGLEMLAFHDDARGLGSGMTGRTDYWASALSRVGNDALLGIGFRMTKIAYGATLSHSGLIDLYLETGLIGFSLIIMYSIKSGWTLWTGREESVPKNIVYAARTTLPSLLIISTLEAHFINIGFPIGVLMILLFGLAAKLAPRR